MSSTRSIALTVTLVIVAAAAGILLARTLLSPRPPAPALATATLLEPPKALPQLAFTDHTGRLFNEQRLQGRWSLLFFGFTSCPEVCPTTLATLAQVEKRLADLPNAERPQIVLVSVDPERDTPAQLATYVRSFSPTSTGITAPLQTVREFAQQMGVTVALTPLGQGYTVDHSATIFLINPDGALRALFSTPHAPHLLAEDYRRILALDGA